MIVKLKEIPEGGLDVVQPLTPQLLEEALKGLLVDPAGLAAARATVSVHLDCESDTVLLRGDLVGEARVPCARCLAEVTIPLATPLHMVFTRGPIVEDATEEEALEDDVDHGVHDGRQLDLGELFREALLLAVPMRALCRADCKGLCPVCGGDRNERSCGCAAPQPDHPFAALKGLKV